MSLNIETLSLGPLGTNAYIVSQNSHALVFDPGAEADRLISMINNKRLDPQAILLTHAHFDHIGAADHLRKHFQIPLYVHKAEADWLTNPVLNGSALFQHTEIIASEADQFLEPGKLQIGTFSFDVLHTPGHSPGGVSFVFNDDDLVISGDCLFRGGIGRTDLTGGDQNVLLASIYNQLFSLPDHFQVYSGHGPKTTIGYEKQNNPFLTN
ncbi:MBL fold metallo-hydrolase [Amphibacillus sediminis]|uniref:MBL fold metallo-hydrolase n=1 Tax=Amphibacillus sediminis TaxID=360185 RepID=UPI0008351014|nr:MBL fold metallo-hydrolase [Amphibacillus sediminis]